MTWDVIPRASLGALYESNPRSESDSSREDDAYALTGALQADIRGATDTTSILLQPRVQAASYSGTARAEDLDYEDYYFPLSITWTEQLAQYRLGGGFSRQSTRSFPSVDPNQPTDPSTRLPFDDEYQERWSISPSAIWQVNPRNSLSVALSADDIEFTDAAQRGRFNYKTVLASATWSTSLSQQHIVSFGSNINAFFAEIPGTTIENDTVSYGANVGYEYVWSESTSVGATLGAAKSEITVKGLPAISTPGYPFPLPCLDPEQNEFVLCELKTDDENFVGELFFRRRNAQTITTQLSASRYIQPSSDGAQVTLDTINGYLTKDFSQMLSGTVGASYTRQEAIGANNEDGIIVQRLSRDYLSTSASLNWRLSRSWQIQGEYAFYRDEQTSGFTYTVPRHRVSITFQYTGLGRR